MSPSLDPHRSSQIKSVLTPDPALPILEKPGRRRSLTLRMPREDFELWPGSETVWQKLPFRRGRKPLPARAPAQRPWVGETMTDGVASGGDKSMNATLVLAFLGLFSASAFGQKLTTLHSLG